MDLSVSFLVYTLLCVGSWSTDSWGRGPKTGGVLGVVRGCKICACNTNVNSPEAAEFQNSIFSPLAMPPLQSAARGACPLVPLPAATAALLPSSSLFSIHVK